MPKRSPFLLTKESCSSTANPWSLLSVSSSNPATYPTASRPASVAKKDKDIWGKISDAASNAGKAITDEYRKVKLSHEIWNLKRDLEKTYAEIGMIIHKNYLEGNRDIDDEIKPFCDEIDETLDAIAALKRRREKISEAAKQAEDATAESSTNAGEPVSKAEESELEFLDDSDMEFSCPECGEDLDAGADFCSNCGYEFDEDEEDD